MRFLDSNLRKQFFGTFLRTEFGILFFFIVRIFKNSAGNCLKNSAESEWQNESYPQSNKADVRKKTMEVERNAELCTEHSEH